ncbi:MAG: VCBS repeat-containing protein, partial [Chitinophagales bacterium]
MKKNIYILLASIFLSTNAFGQASFPEVSAQLGVQHVAVFSDSIYTPQGGAAWLDFNNDHNLDLYLTGGANPDALYKNNGDGTFTDVTISAGVDVLSASNTMGVVSGDIDNDGYNDLFITTVSSDQNFLLYNNGDGTFTDISMDAGVSGGGNSSSAAFGDYNLDGLLDLYVVNWCVDIYFPFDTSDTFPTIQNYFYINNGDLTFTESSKALGVDVEGGCSLGVLFTDYDND